MNNEQYNEIIKLLNEINKSIGLQILEKVLLVCVGIVPSILSAWLTYVWLLKKEKVMFNLNTEKEDKRNLSKIAGKIKGLAYELRGNAAQAQDFNVKISYLKCHSKFDINKAEANEMFKEINPLTTECIKELAQKKSAFLELVGEYCYYLPKDLVLEDLIEKFSSQRAVIPDGLEKLTKEEISKINYEDICKDFIERNRNEYFPPIKNIVDYIF